MIPGALRANPQNDAGLQPHSQPELLPEPSPPLDPWLTRERERPRPTSKATSQENGHWGRLSAFVYHTDRQRGNQTDVTGRCWRFAAHNFR